MSYNPYQSPGMVGQEPGAARDPSPGDRLKVPAIGLIIVVAISVGLMLLSTAIDMIFFATGLIDNDGPQVAVVVRIVWGLLILVCNLGSLYGALQMLWLQNRTIAQAGCILACIPCLSPCLILGIPFGIWGLVILGDDQVRSEFKS